MGNFPRGEYSGKKFSEGEFSSNHIYIYMCIYINLVELFFPQPYGFTVKIMASSWRLKLNLTLLQLLQILPVVVRETRTSRHNVASIKGSPSTLTLTYFSDVGRFQETLDEAPMMLRGSSLLASFTPDRFGSSKRDPP